jgi:hypothetical protein
MRAWEKFLKKEQRRKDEQLFKFMEDNIRSSLLRNELIPGIPRSATARLGPPQEPLPAPPSQIRVRTISAMNENLLSEINSSSEENHKHSSNNNNSKRSNHQHHSMPNSTTPSTATASASTIGSNRAGPLVKGRPPLPTQRSRA